MGNTGDLGDQADKYVLLPTGGEEPWRCTCDGATKRSGGVCRWCYHRGRRKASDPKVEEALVIVGTPPDEVAEREAAEKKNPAFPHVFVIPEGLGHAGGDHDGFLHEHDFIPASDKLRRNARDWYGFQIVRIVSMMRDPRPPHEMRALVQGRWVRRANPQHKQNGH